MRVQGKWPMILQFLPLPLRSSVVELSFRHSVLWTSSSPSSVLHCYWMWCSQTLLLEICIPVRHPSPLLHRERMEPSWRPSKHTHKPLHVSSLIDGLRGSVTLEVLDLGTTSPHGHWFPGGQCLKSLLLKSRYQRKDLKATVGTDCLFSQSDLWKEGSNSPPSAKSIIGSRRPTQLVFPMPSLVPGI